MFIALVFCPHLRIYSKKSCFLSKNVYNNRVFLFVVYFYGESHVTQM